jgi:dTDP-4-dehydrorhamnose reductase
MNSKKVYITGIWGMLGYKIAKSLENDCSIFGCDLFQGFTNLLKSDKITTIDLSDYTMISEEIKDIHPDVIIHTAAMINVDLCEEHPDDANRINAEITENLAKISKKIGAKFVYISTDAVFDGEKSGKFTEDDKVNPVNIYGKSKLTGEFKTTENSNNYLILRTNIYGWNIQKKLSFAEWVYDSLASNKVINMFNDVLFSPIYVGNFAEVLKDLLNKDTTGLYHLAGNDCCSKLEFGVALAKTFSFDEKLIKSISLDDFSGFKAKRIKNMSLNSNRVSKITDCKILGLYDGLKLFATDIKNYRSN